MIEYLFIEPYTHSLYNYLVSYPTGGSPTDVVVRLLDSDLLVMSSTPGITLSYGSKYNYLLVIF